MMREIRLMTVGVSKTNSAFVSSVNAHVLITSHDNFQEPPCLLAI